MNENQLEIQEKKLPKLEGYENCVVYLLKHRPFYAHFLQAMNLAVVRSISTLGVSITDQINLLINPFYFNSLKAIERVAVLEHEVLHILNKHIIRRDSRNEKIWNIACDMAVNCYLENLPKGGVYPKLFKLPEFKESEFYYRKLIKDAVEIELCIGETGSQSSGKKGNGDQEGMIIDDHSLWGKGNESKDYQHEIIKNAIKKSIEQVKDYGYLPAGIQAEINKALHHKTLNWRSVLHKFIYRATLVNYVPTRKRMNRRFGFYYDGNKVECKLSLLVAVDTSGSISEEELAMFFAEIEKIKALGMKVLVVECDAAVQKVYPYHITPKIVMGRGGTAFEPVFKLAKERKPDAIVYLTDLYANTNFKNESRIPTLWAITKGGGDVKNVPFGIGVKLDE